VGVILVAIHRGGAEVLRHYLRDNHEMTVGRDETNELRIPSLMLSRRHCRFVLDANGDVRVSDAASTSGTWLNERRLLQGEQSITEHDAVRIGDWILSYERELTIEDRPGLLSQEERTFLQHIASHPTDEATRQVYADWLEDQGNRALEIELLTTPSQDLSRQSTASKSWMCIMLDARIEGCEQQGCATTWRTAQPIAGHIQLRRCERCDKTIYYAASPEEARAWTTNNERTAVAG